MIPPGLVIDDALVYLSIAKQAKPIRRNGISPVDLVSPYRSSRIEKLNRLLRSLTTFCTDRGRNAAPQTESQTP